MSTASREVPPRVGNGPAGWAREQRFHEFDGGFQRFREVGQGIDLRSKVGDRGVQRPLASVQRPARTASRSCWDTFSCSSSRASSLFR